MSVEPLAFTGLLGDRYPSFTYELLGVDETPLGWIDGVKGGSLDYSTSSTIKVGGKLDVDDVDGIDWAHARLRPWAIVNDVTWPLGLFVPTAPRESWHRGYRSWTVELLGKLTTLDQDCVPYSVSYPAGTVVTSAVREQIAAAGQTGAAITDSPAVLASGMVWEAGTSRLKIINDLLETINYWSLWTDGAGRFRADPYVRPAARPVRHELLDGEQSIYSDSFTKDQDLFTIPNRVVAIGVGSATTPALVGTWENTDPSSPWSTVSRGLTRTHVENNVEAVDQAAIDAYARRRGIELSSVAATIPVQHALIPLDLNDVVRFRRVPAGIDARHTVQAMTISFNPLELMTATYREVQDL